MSEAVTAMQQAFEAMLTEVNTSAPGVIVSYDAARNRAVVRPSLSKRLADGEELAAPVIHEVPVLWPAAGGAVLTMPVQPGDGVLLVFSQRALEGWLAGNAQAPDDPRHHDITDAVALPGLRASAPAVDATNVVLSLGGTRVRIEPGGVVRITGNLIVEGTIVASGNVTAGTITLQTHRHTGVQTGTGTTQGPVA